MGATRRDIVVIGGSAGSLEALTELVSALPGGMDAALFLVVHIMPAAVSQLPSILTRRGRVPARHARSGDAIERGRILVAPPDHHMLLRVDRVELNRGPMEQSSRPAIDPLFRSAAQAFGPRVCAVVLSGNLKDGSDGLRAVIAAGGVGVVQDLEEALHPDMPRNALAGCPTCPALPARGIGVMLSELAEQNARPA